MQILAERYSFTGYLIGTRDALTNLTTLQTTPRPARLVLLSWPITPF